MFRLLAFALAAAWAAPVDLRVTPSEAPGDHHALVIGLSSYAHLSEAATLDHARSEAALLRDTLKGPAGYDSVITLLDRQATRERILHALTVELPETLEPADTLLITFLGHGVGADMGMPSLLPHDATVATAHETALGLQELVDLVTTHIHARQVLVFTDAIHHRTHDGLFLHGPAATEWPALPPDTWVVSSSSAGEASRDGRIGSTLADALSGAADASGDGTVDGTELLSYLQTELSRMGQHPAVSRTDGLAGVVVASGVTPGRTVLGGSDGQALTVDHFISAAKFVFTDGDGVSVRCKGTEEVPCSPTCYLRDFQAGACQISAVRDGKTRTGSALVLTPGLYDCSEMAEGTLSCVTEPPRTADH